MSKTAYYQENGHFLALSTDKIYAECFCLTRKKTVKTYYNRYEDFMNGQKIGSNMHSTLSIIRYIIYYNESVSLISPFILCDLRYDCKRFGVVIC